MNEQVNYSYDAQTIDGTFPSQYTLGRLAAVTFKNQTSGSPEQFAYLYSYTQTGRVTTQRMRMATGATLVNLNAQYEWDNEGRMRRE